MAKGDGWPWVRQKAHQTMQVWGHMNRVFRGAWRAGRRVSSAVATYASGNSSCPLQTSTPAELGQGQPAC